MRTGRLRHKITIQEKTRTADGKGGWTTAWADMITAYASITTPRGFERVEAMKLTGKAQHHLIVYFDSKIKSIHRILWHDGNAERVLDISDVSDPNGMRRYLEIIAHEDTD